MIKRLIVLILAFSFSTGYLSAEIKTADQTWATDLGAFESIVIKAKELGNTRVELSRNIPPSLWQFDSPGDPYPAWYVDNPGLLKIFPPDELKLFVDMDYAKRASAIIEERCKILRKHGMKGHWSSSEPQVMPKTFFQTYPKLRGPRVEQPNRSRIARFSLCVDQPESLRLYREALKNMWSRCPEIESFSFLTQDSGSGFCWAPSLYPGINGHSNCKNRRMEERIAGFMKNFQEAANEFDITVTMNINPIGPRQWMIPTFSPQVLDAIVRLLPPGMAVQGREGPDGRRFSDNSDLYHADVASRSVFYPVVGVPTRGSGRSNGNHVERLIAQRNAAVEEVGEELSDELLTVWISLGDAQIKLDALNFGGMLRFGHTLGRWINRPLVCFPEELKPEEKDYYQRHLFQSRTEGQADNLVDIQGMLMYQGWGAKMLFQRVIETTIPDVRRAHSSARRIADNAKDEKISREWELNAKRIEAVICLLKSADNVVAYQAHLDRADALDLKPEYNPPLGVQSDWARTDIMEIARKEIDNTVHLIELIESTDEPIIDMAPTAEEEYVMRLGPNLVEQLKLKIDIMNTHWMDYDRLFTRPNQ
jgi:hypothetical protein